MFPFGRRLRPARSLTVLSRGLAGITPKRQPLQNVKRVGLVPNLYMGVEALAQQIDCMGQFIQRLFLKRSHVGQKSPMLVGVLVQLWKFV